MQAFWQDILTNIVANLISDLLLWLVIGIIGLSIVREIIRYRRLRQFFGLVGNSDLLLVYLSSLPVAKDGLVNRYGKKHSFDQLTLTAVEVETISWLSVVFASDPLQRLPRIVRDFFARHWAFRLVQVDQRPSPLLEEQLEHAPMLIIGGPYFNSAAKYYQEKGLSFLKFNPIDDYEDKTQWITVEATRGERKGFTIPTSEKDDLGVLERFTDDKTGATVIWAAGARTNGMRASVYYLVHHWNDLKDKYGNKEFAVCLKCHGRNIDPEAYRKATVLLEWSKQT